jgi:UDP:flavonoid glycosyltransferase YjiC (YdhE family)
MRITILAAGSRGDIQPIVALGRGLQQAGYTIRMAVPENFGQFVKAHGLDFYPLRGDIQQIMAGETGRDFMQSGGANPVRSIKAIRTMLAPVVLQIVEDAFVACSNADALICLAVLGLFGQSIAQARGIPLIAVEPTPMLPTRAFPAPSWPLQRNLGGFHNRISGHLMLQVVWLWYRPFVNEFRSRLGLSPYRSASFYHILASTRLLGAYSPAVIPRPADWPDTAHIPGYWFLEGEGDWLPPAGLEDFLEAGKPPVYVGFGSMGGQDPEQLAGVVLDALVKSGQRGVLLTGWGGIRAQDVPENVFILDSAPHSWLFPRMAAVVHHGGAGTTAEGLRAGVPSVIVPFILDQPFWGKRIQSLGVGPEPIPRKKLTAANLSRAIRLAVTDADIRQRAAALGTAIRDEDGIGKAVKIVQQVWRS